jgi:predicted dehydrogenase
LLDFATAIQTGAQPRVTGAAGRDAVAVAERILASIAHNASLARTLHRAA